MIRALYRITLGPLDWQSRVLLWLLTVAWLLDAMAGTP